MDENRIPIDLITEKSNKYYNRGVYDGIFVELPSSVEGLVRLADMGDDYYNYDEENFCVLGERTKKMYKIGDSVRIKVVNVDIDRKEIDFKILKKY